MKRILTHLLTAIVAVLMAGCGGGGSGSAPPAPTGVSAVAGDATVTVTWIQEGFTYWVWSVISNAINILGCSTCSTNTSNASSPFVATGFAQGGWLTNAGTPSLTNSAQYTFTVNAHSGDSPGSPAASSVTVVPRLAGGTGTWITGETVSGVGANLTGLDFGAPYTALTAASAVGSTGMFVAVDSSGNTWWTNMAGVSGRFDTTTNDGLYGTWAQGTTTGNPLRAVAYSSNYFVAVGDSGKIWRSSDGMSWTEVDGGVPTGTNLTAVVGYGAVFIAVGTGGKIYYNGSYGASGSWTAENSNTGGLDLSAIATDGSGNYVAVGASGAVTYSSGGTSWTETALGGAPTLAGVAYGAPLINYVQNASGTVTTAPTATWVIVDQSGNQWTNTTNPPSTASWTSRPSAISLVHGSPITGITYGHQFLAIDSSGWVYPSLDGLNWPTTSAVQATGNPLSAIKPFVVMGGQYAGQYIYGAVGSAGTALIAR